jgi:UDP-glucuronate decarboxylase
MKRAPDPQTVAVTGGAGFVGSHLCERLVEAGYEVIAVDDLSTGDPLHLDHLHDHPRFRSERCDIAQGLPASLQRAARIFNLACPASPAYYQQHPVQTTLTSVLGMWHLLELAQRSGAQVLQASTSEVYGDPQVHPQTESYHGHVNPIGPRSCYDEGKRCAEALAFAYHRERGVPIRIARLFNSYGPRLTPGDGRVVSNFVVQALRGDPLTVYGDGGQTRSFCYVDDTVEGLMRLMNADAEGPINLGNPDEHTVLELAEIVLRMTGSRSRVVHRPLPADDPQRRKPDIALAGSRLGWRPQVPLEVGLERTVRYFRELLELDAGRVYVLPSQPAGAAGAARARGFA